MEYAKFRCANLDEIVLSKSFSVSVHFLLPGKNDDTPTEEDANEV